MAIFNSIIFIFGMLYAYYNNPTFNLVKTYKNYKYISIKNQYIYGIIIGLLCGFIYQFF